MRSIRQQLLWWQIGALVVTGVLASLVTYRLAWSGFNRIRDYGLQQIAYSVIRHGARPLPAADALTLPPPEVDQSPPAPPALPHRPAGEDDDDLGQFVSQIWRPDGSLLYTSIDGRRGPTLQAPGLHIVEWNGEPWRVYTVIGREQTVQVAVTSADRAASFAELAPWLLAPLGLLVLLLGLLIHTAVQKALAPLEDLGRELRRREGRDLHALQTDNLPVELAPLGEALNALLARVQALLQGQRTLLADVAHELNTPLAAIKLQAQLARRTADHDRGGALDELDRGIERATHLVAQLLQIARLQPGVREVRIQAVRLDALAADAVAAYSAHADARDIDLGLARREPVSVRGDAHELRVLIDNLVDNALRHAPTQSRVDVQVHAADGQAWLDVIDHGPGIAPSERARALQRFVRLRPQDGMGSGLGLSIVQRIVQQHAGELSLRETPGGGLSVQVRLPLTPPDPDAEQLAPRKSADGPAP